MIRSHKLPVQSGSLQLSRAHCPSRPAAIKALQPCRRRSQIFQHTAASGPEHSVQHGKSRLHCRASQAQQLEAASKDSRHTAARQVVERFYACYNAGDVEGMMSTMAPNCAYHDLALYNEPHVGHEEIRGFFLKVFATVPGDLDFVLDAISADEQNCSVKWHCEIAGSEFPFSRGVSFYEVNEDGLIVAGRDLVESAAKPGGVALKALALLAPVVRKLGPKANPGQLKKLPQRAILMFGVFAAWFWLIYLSDVLPGAPAWRAEPWVVKETLDESLNFWFLNSLSQYLKLPYIPFDKWNPVHEAFFNFENAWSFLFLPTIMNDPRGRFRTPLWFGSMFLTNVFMLPYMALRLLPVSRDQERSRPQLPLGPFRWPSYTPLYGVIGGFVGAVCVWWGLAYRPEYGGLADRAAYFVEAFKTDRAFILITTDCLLYSVWQWVLMQDAPEYLRRLPFIGLAAWLIGVGRPAQEASRVKSPDSSAAQNQQ